MFALHAAAIIQVNVAPLIDSDNKTRLKTVFLGQNLKTACFKRRSLNARTVAIFSQILFFRKCG